MDDDLQHPPEEIPKLIDAIANDSRYDVVVGRYDSKKHNIIRNMGTNLSNYISYKTYGKPRELELTSFRIMKRFVVDELLRLTVDVPRIGNMLVQINGNIGNVLVEHDPRKYGRSGYTFARLVRDLFSNLITNSSFPLLVVRDIGIASFCVSVILAVFYLLRYFVRGVSIVGWTTLALLIISYSGLLLFAVGIIGDYLLRILNEAKKMPKYYIRRKSVDDGENGEEKSHPAGGNFPVL
jgi:dolichol-phosphate mannosyltransferase/undecaprenyl-phosphate 4-deoxy-4-formamido-L-arabinose transferase